MKEQALTSLNELEQLQVTSQIAFFNELQHESFDQFEFLMQNSKLQEYSSGEVILAKLDKSPFFYSLLRGTVDVFSTDKPGPFAVGQLTAGQLFGFLAVLNDQERTATLAASQPEGCKVLATDFSSAGELHDFSRVHLNTKLRLYRNAVNNTRWKLEVYKNATKDLTLTQELSLFGLFEGEKGSPDELDFLSNQCQELASLLDCWNDVAEPTIEIPESNSDTPFTKVMSLFKKK